MAAGAAHPPGLHVAFHLAEVFADALEPAHLVAAHEPASVRFQLFDPLLIGIFEIEAVHMTLVDQRRDAETRYCAILLEIRGPREPITQREPLVRRPQWHSEAEQDIPL
jgi:hypothetical protein